ncbi:MAG: SDR family oxidoreductase [Elusimicrobia bacterium]|nr:SDR family oxidoreductase [Candidatus Obscuribacterium magneticum]
MRMLEGRFAVITGANQGLGKAIAQAYVDAGASVYICARGKELLEQTRDELIRRAAGHQQVFCARADVAESGEIADFFEKVFLEFPQLDILVNNAGIYGPKGFIEEVDWDEWIKAIQINLYGVVLACRAVLPHFKKNGYGKIINLSGGGATNPLPRISAYAASKAAVARFSETLAEELRGSGIDVNLIAPGALNTKLMQEVIDAGPEKVGEEFYNKTLKQQIEGGTPLEKGANLAVFLGSSLSDGITGKLISAIWDPWERFPEHLSELSSSDIYTLRRIVPKDRGKNWGDR